MLDRQMAVALLASATLLAACASGGDQSRWQYPSPGGVTKSDTYLSKVAATLGSGEQLTRTGVTIPKPLRIDDSPSDLPAACAEYLGYWGDGLWNGVRPGALVVHSVSPDDDASCTAQVTFAWGSNLEERVDYKERDNMPGMTSTSAQISGKKLVLDEPLFEEKAKVAYERDGDVLYGTYRTSNTTDYITLKKRSADVLSTVENTVD